jgi:hypothetical protein
MQNPECLVSHVARGTQRQSYRRRVLLLAFSTFIELNIEYKYGHAHARCPQDHDHATRTPLHSEPNSEDPGSSLTASASADCCAAPPSEPESASTIGGPAGVAPLVGFDARRERWDSGPEVVGDCHDISVPPMKTTVSVECPTALYMAKPHALAGSACTQGETKVPHRGQPAAPRPQRPREWSAEVRRTCAELAMNLRESYGILLHLEITGDRDHVTPRSIGAGTSTLVTSTPRPMHLRG